MTYTLGEIADALDLEVRGDASVEISGIANLIDAKSDQLTFLFNPAYLKQLADSAAAAVVLNDEYADSCNLPVLVCAQPRLAWARIAGLFDQTPQPSEKIHPTAVVSPTATHGSDVTIGAYAVVEARARLDKNVVVGPGCFIGEAVTIGEYSRLSANVSVYHGVTIGERAIIHSGAVIGADGFGFEPDYTTGSLVKIPQIFSVSIGDDVEIGAGTTIDRGALNDTSIANGVKLDNQVQIGHGTCIGANTAISGCTAIAGSTKIGAHCLIGGAVGIIDNIEIVDQVEITAMSLVSRSIRQKGRYSSGTGLMPGKSWKRSIVGFAKLDEIIKRLRALERQLKK
ncbi:MAG: UDP-3-O-(3-hydroxymyristoyl)glucosamine N-acyltransferase [Pseudomonadales bacterium]|nr:UDP-3-O-(3-hydroxymyristoyl)glucosamine N-acyltransferase [Pseudomonadales bacterium]MDP6316956.1 UDP-3-O-(3-hydroxymyristoyl)glucosamine N-acyltransferase [Pseudomonadales bacterium]MDP7314237.1 UDP-3-O-(3-hydroxymyristoyl)glucosamine N-acyltransferase [Pseudomonadales bacterium]